MPPRGGRKGGGRRGGPLKEITLTSIMIVLIAGAILMIVRANDIRNVDEFLSYTGALADDFANCSSTLIGRNDSECAWQGPGEASPPGNWTPPGSGDNDWEPPNGSGSNGNGDNGNDNGGSGNDGGDREFFGETGRGGDINTGESAFGGNYGLNYGLDYYEVLDSIEVNDDPPTTSEVGYDRTDFRHWISHGEGCNTRHIVLIEQGVGVETGERCRIEAGEWFDPFTGETTDDSSSLDIDHLVPVGYAAIHGAYGDPNDPDRNEWSSERKEEFANDIKNLRAVSASENRSKGADDLTEYNVPEYPDFQCEYAQIWIEVLSDYDLTSTTENKEVMRENLETC